MTHKSKGGYEHYDAAVCYEERLGRCDVLDFLGIVLVICKMHISLSDENRAKRLTVPSVMSSIVVSIMSSVVMTSVITTRLYGGHVFDGLGVVSII